MLLLLDYFKYFHSIIDPFTRCSLGRWRWRHDAGGLALPAIGAPYVQFSERSQLPGDLFIVFPTAVGVVGLSAAVGAAVLMSIMVIEDEEELDGVEDDDEDIFEKEDQVADQKTEDDHRRQTYDDERYVIADER